MLVFWILCSKKNRFLTTLQEDLSNVDDVLIKCPISYIILVKFVQIPLSSKNDELQPLLAGKRRVVALNKKDLANPNIMHVMSWLTVISDVYVCVNLFF